VVLVVPLELLVQELLHMLEDLVDGYNPEQSVHHLLQEVLQH
jgi:hypothetical protein